MNDVAFQLTLPPDTFRALQTEAEARQITVAQFLVELVRDHLEREAQLAAGRAKLRALPRRATTSDAPRDLAARHDLTDSGHAQLSPYRIWGAGARPAPTARLTSARTTD